tara:strand:- start:5118 stop:5243 length:126 start_codon:yes stop_codon:yes gene_type:complete
MLAKVIEKLKHLKEKIMYGYGKKKTMPKKKKKKASAKKKKK